MPVIACVPNVSEGRRKDVIEHLIETVDMVRGVRLLDVSVDPRINRSIFTFIGRPSALLNAVLNLTDEAIKHIDLREHHGSYPRMGVIDVIPFVPLYDTPMDKAVELARKTGRELAERFSIPVYLYENAATSEDRHSINHIREGEFEGFAEKILEPEWKPDFGPLKIHPSAGVSAVGAREPLIAVNLVFDTRDKSVIKDIARCLREDHFDRELLKVIPLENGDDDKLKISATIINYKKLTICQLVDAARKEALKRGISFSGSEIVGLVTGDALFDCLKLSMGLSDFNLMQILEFHLPNRVWS